jgi:hypothetical protein
MSSRRDFLTKSLGYVGAGIVGSTLLSKITFDESKGIEVGKTKTDDFKDAILVAGQCGMGLNCSGGGGTCGMGLGCGGGGGSCGMGLGCGGS